MSGKLTGLALRRSCNFVKTYTVIHGEAMVSRNMHGQQYSILKFAIKVITFNKASQALNIQLLKLLSEEMRE